MISIREIDPADLALFDEWYDAFRAGAVAGREAPLVEGREALGYSLRNPGPLKTRCAVGAFEDDRVLGAMLFEYRLADNLDTVEVEIDVPPEHRRRGIGRALWQWAVTRASQLGRTIVQTELGVPADPWPGAAFASQLGFAVEHVEEHLVVPLPYDDLLLEDLRSAAGRLDGYRLTSWAGVCPSEYRQEYADLRTAMDRDVPTGGMTREVLPWTVEKLETSEARVDRNYLALVTMAHTLDGAPAGYTLIFLPRADAEHAQQDDTLVLREHRGHNLGTFLKLANLAQLAEHRTTQRFLHTWTALTNAPMRKVNARFGFRAVEQNRELELELPRLRPAARGVIVDSDDQVLLVRFEFADGPVWATPGGGLEAGETMLEGLRRELIEEVGLKDFPDPLHLWHEEHVAEGHATGYDGVLNDYFLVRTDHFTPGGSLSAAELRDENVHAVRWWSLAELAAHDGRFAPPDLPDLLHKLIQSGTPGTPAELGT
ncbi:ADP-ribose pyrophosphatase YjhB (NUDIX family)/GNAT superfamily N-acetyltransferase [Kribbella aluminosa]|uniref:ADP-ribose pyrophosphatase YjhB (NUDIX family)/GNAT superfamily N-acetyltransferase n=1 Tax=Kribbella aluminosa TaxID=416017 RepID=A0ABS4UY25_9ACTN|nr:GNAT family N-acetyltransferase [Kribbella aluminosa]MBP2356539.1 ADP-ribose pyrophosphatase YjhB (NUDIX family)/GNAT superfamily N-acetyltransferase [Kribbella aluminosa]